MGFKRLAVASVVGAGVVAVGVAAPAYGTDQISQNAVGTYDAVYPWVTATWVVTPCAQDTPQCVHVTEYGAEDAERKTPFWSADAHWNVGWWIMRGVNTPNALTCEDGSTHDLSIDFAWDAASGEGVRSYREPGICDGTVTNGSNDITVTKVGPAPL
ncbi:hypothetical protein [Mycobacterium sp. E740]|uniref:hypothetical protein n=1 Tax=Mycobacterium sp. E740 TaxID=1834149 RepID=UPI0008003316|nr:hypothetical protein [Mycobacterium sp. E740]OBI83637.1 hypothetical protein A5663_12535 [Mycobacterium sp. E740]